MALAAQTGRALKRRRLTLADGQIHDPFRWFDPSPELIQLIVRLYVRYPLSLRNVEDLAFERGVSSSPQPTPPSTTTSTRNVISSAGKFSKSAARPPWLGGGRLPTRRSAGWANCA